MMSTEGKDTFENIFVAVRCGCGGAGSALCPSNVEVTVDSSFGRVKDEPEGERLVDEAWEKLTNNSGKNRVLYNGLKFRLQGVLQREGGCHLQLGITDYRSSIGTTFNVERYTQIAVSKGNNVRNYLANALGVECFTTTTDDKAVLFRRSSLVSEYPGYYCFPGGHPEPEDLMRRQQLGATVVGENVDEVVQDGCFVNSGSQERHVAELLAGLESNVLVQHIFDSAVAEVVDELGIEATACRNRGLLCIVEDKRTMKPDACFWVEVGKTAAEVEMCFNKRSGADAFESVPHSLVLVDLSTIKDDATCKLFIDQCLEGRITPASLACFQYGIECYHKC